MSEGGMGSSHVFRGMEAAMQDPRQPEPIPPQPPPWDPEPPIGEPEPDRLPDEAPTPNPDENPEPPQYGGSPDG
ncbi:hypothetical protein NGR_b11130 (plasmid) [Sinorhizobium fredii NGR234]|uniref:Uncharacterized protein n=2 Tax=Rhizobium fredii TaxID=380 RepID=C3KR58_SINFN|nr:hypothetical protein NGR_b11130 [Sinorhizobium fredii NGR234]